MNWLILDVSSCAVEGVENYLTPASERRAPASYSKPESIAAWQAEDFQDDLDRAALDWDLARITGVGYAIPQGHFLDGTAETPEKERALVYEIASRIREADMLIGFGARNFDWPLLMRRARYLGVDFPEINLDRYRSPHIDLCELLSHGDRQKQKPLSFWIRRLGWSDLTKPLSGKEEAQIFQHERWSDLAASLAHDVEATYRLAQWAKVIR